MRITIAAALALVLAACGSSAQNKKGAGMAEEGFVALFDGVSTKGWHTYNQTAVGSAWKVENGALRLDVSNKVNGKVQGGGDLVTNDSFDNFHLKLEWKVSPGANSGIMFYVKEDAAYSHTYLTGPEMQVIDNDRHSDGKIAKHRAGDLYDLIACTRETVKPVGEWNLAEIIANKGQIELRLNGGTVVKTSYGDAAWKAMVANSKFKSMPAFGTFSSGKISLQDHGDEVWYRNIMIKKL